MSVSRGPRSTPAGTCHHHDDEHTGASPAVWYL